MTNISIKAKLWGNLAVVLTFYIAMWFLSYYSSVQIGANLDSAKVEAMREADTLRLTLKDVQLLANDAAQLKDTVQLDEADSRAEEFSKAIKRLQKLDPENVDEYIQTWKDFQTYYTSAYKAAELLINEDVFSEDLREHAKVVTSTLPTLKSDVDKILHRSYDTFSDLLDRSTHVASLLVTQNFVLLMTVVMLSAIVFPMIIRSITKPINKLVDATNEIAGGNLDVQAEVVSLDEIGGLAISFNRMTRMLKEKNEALERTAGALQSSLGVRREMQKKILDANAELKSANLKLREADRLKTEFLASMSHELRTPLNAIINFTDQILEDWTLLQDDKEWFDEANGMLSRVLRSSRHLLALINDLLDLAKVESGIVTLDLVEADIREIAADAIASVSSLAKAKNLQMKLTAPDDPRLFKLDERRILQVFINLLSNSIKFTEKGYLEIDIKIDKKTPDGAIINVIDTGIGIPEEHLDIVFDRFRQVDGGDARSHTGTGLGLNLVKELVELHGGWVKVTSEVGKGSVFTFYLPYVAQTGDLE